MADKIIGGEGPAKGRKCAHCGEPFEFQEFTNYLFRIWSNYIVCIACTENNYLASTEKKGLKTMLFLLSALVGFVFFLAVMGVMLIGSYDPADGSFYIVYWMVALAVFGGVGIVKYAMAIFRWFTGTLMKRDPYL